MTACWPETFLLTLGNGKTHEFTVWNDPELGWFSRIVLSDTQVFNSGACPTKEHAVREAKYRIAEHHQTTVGLYAPKDYVNEIAMLEARASELQAALSHVTRKCMRPEQDEERCPAGACRMCHVEGKHLHDCPWLVALKALGMDDG